MGAPPERRETRREVSGFRSGSRFVPPDGHRRDGEEVVRSAPLQTGGQAQGDRHEWADSDGKAPAAMNGFLEHVAVSGAGDGPSTSERKWMASLGVGPEPHN